MGLDTTHDCWHGAYSAFRRWRIALATAAGYKIAEDVGGWNSEDYALPWNEFTAANYEGEWDRVPGDDPLIYLLIHSDCGGVIHPEQGRHIALRLRELCPTLPEDGSGHIRSMRGGDGCVR